MQEENTIIMSKKCMQLDAVSIKFQNRIWPNWLDYAAPTQSMRWALELH